DAPQAGVGGRAQHRSARRGRSLFGQIASFAQHGVVSRYSSPCRELVPGLRPRHCGRRNGPYIHLLYIKPRAGNGGIGHGHSMSAKPQQLGSPNVGTPPSTIPMGLRVLAMALRALFIGALVLVTVRVSSPQSETFSSVYETPGDLIRLALGFGVCLWIVIHLFMLPKDAEGYRTWVYLGLVVAPLALVVAFVIW